MLTQFLNRFIRKKSIKDFISENGNCFGCHFHLEVKMDKQLDLLYQSATFYNNNLSNKRFEIIIGRKGQNKRLELLFLPCHFYHLIGLHKLTDIPRLRRSPDNIFREILSGKISYKDIEKSMFLSQIQNRMIYHSDLFNLLNTDSLFFKSLHGKFKGIFADCVLTKSTEDSLGYSFLFLAIHDNIHFPCSFFTRDEMREYTKEGTKWMILSIKEID